MSKLWFFLSQTSFQMLLLLSIQCWTTAMHYWLTAKPICLQLVDGLKRQRTKWSHTLLGSLHWHMNNYHADDKFVIHLWKHCLVSVHQISPYLLNRNHWSQDAGHYLLYTILTGVKYLKKFKISAKAFNYKEPRFYQFGQEPEIIVGTRVIFSASCLTTVHFFTLIYIVSELVFLKPQYWSNFSHQIWNYLNLYE